MSIAAPLNSICLLRLSAIGDCCHAVALVQHIQKHWPNTRITWVIGKIEAQLMCALLPDVEFIIFDKNDGFAAYKTLRQQLKGRRFDALLHLQANMRANIASLCIPAKKRIGFGRERARELQWLFTNVKAPIGPGVHVAEGFMDFVVALGLPAAKPSWDVSAPEEDLAWAEQFVDDRPLLIICPAASKPEKNWTAEGYAAVARHANKQGAKVILVGSPATIEIELAAATAKLAPCIDDNLVGKTSLTQLLALIQRATLVVAPDTGPTHMATLVGTPVIGLYATHNPQRTGPYHNLDKVVSVYEQALFEETGKTPEEAGWRTRIKDKGATLRIQSQSVIGLLVDLLNQQKQ